MGEKRPTTVQYSGIDPFASALQVYTSLISYDGPDRLNITRKSGDGLGSVFAPTWALIMPVHEAKRRGSMPPDVWQRYVEGYTKLMLRSEQLQPASWAELLARERIVLCCYCHDTVFCHRRVLATILAQRGSIDHGEVSPQWRPPKK